MNLPKHMPALDGLRAAAVTLVIASHAFPMAHELPWTVKRFSNLGFYGVQLFFLVSCITLANSWRRQELAGRPSVRGFALRRLFRIAPAYFLAAVGYAWLIEPEKVDAVRLMTFLTFTNGWTPAQMPTIQNVWIGVPGGWSIETEFAFYTIFPFLMLRLRGLRRALVALLASLPLAWAANSAGWAAYEPSYGGLATDQFLYYWLPNQIPVFLCGLVTYELIVRLSPNGQWQRTGDSVARHSAAIIGLGMVVFASLAILPWPRLPYLSHGFVGSHVVAAAAFAAIAIALTVRANSIMVHPVVVRLGQASFSAYLIHFVVLMALEHLLPTWVLAQAGLPAVIASLLIFWLVLITTGLVAQMTYRLIELPGVRIGQMLFIMGKPRATLATGSG